MKSRGVSYFFVSYSEVIVIKLLKKTSNVVFRVDRPLNNFNIQVTRTIVEFNSFCF